MFHVELTDGKDPHGMPTTFERVTSMCITAKESEEGFPWVELWYTLEAQPEKKLYVGFKLEPGDSANVMGVNNAHN